MSIRDEYVFCLVLVLSDTIYIYYTIDFRKKLRYLFCGRNKTAFRSLAFNTKYRNLISQPHM